MIPVTPENTNTNDTCSGVAGWLAKSRIKGKLSRENMCFVSYTDFGPRELTCDQIYVIYTDS